ncbi:MAG: carboxypeptidase regulatory-like domain-containing protein [Vulcanimicrobiota bacterium]
MCALCFISGCNNDGQGNALPLSFPGSSGTTLQGGATLNGTVVDGDSLGPLDNATVFLGILKTATDAQGNYSFTGIAAGSQTMKVTYPDYEDFSQQVQTTDGQATTQDIAMATTLDDWLEQGTAYNWQVEAVQADGTVIQGPVWNFTTEPARGVRTLRVTDGVNPGLRSLRLSARVAHPHPDVVLPPAALKTHQRISDHDAGH